MSAGVAMAQSGPVVVELYTSQGCSSCPPADELMHKLADRDDVIALALHVDYWDYIGWKDSFAHPAHAERQRGFARAAGRRSVYTPQMIVNGDDHLVGTRPMELSELVMAHSRKPASVALKIVRQGGDLSIRAVAVDFVGRTEVQLIRYDRERSVSIKRGENAGHDFSYANVVTSWDSLGFWDGEGELELDTRVSGDAPLVVLIQREAHGPIVAAARLR